MPNVILYYRTKLMVTYAYPRSTHSYNYQKKVNVSNSNKSTKTVTFSTSVLFKFVKLQQTQKKLRSFKISFHADKFAFSPKDYIQKIIYRCKARVYQQR
jgi:hypothetical protein